MMSASFSRPQTFSSPEAALLLVNTENGDLWKGSIFLDNAQGIRFVFTANQIVRLHSKHVECQEVRAFGLPVLDLRRGRTASGDENGPQSFRFFWLHFKTSSTGNENANFLSKGAP